MAIWEPPSTVGTKEVIGRRLYRSQTETSPTSQQLQIADFLEQRISENLSVDRLGATGLVNSVVLALAIVVSEEQPANIVSTSHQKILLGWACIVRDKLRFPGWNAEIICTPTHLNGGVHNKWHADVSLTNFADKAQRYMFAATIRGVFETSGFAHHLT